MDNGATFRKYPEIAREVSPPFKPYVESDESVANFDVRPYRLSPG